MFGNAFVSFGKTYEEDFRSNHVELMVFGAYYIKSGIVASVGTQPFSF